MTRDDILEMAKKMVNVEPYCPSRPPEDSFDNIAKLWSVYLGCDLGPSDVANLMGLMKVARNTYPIER